MVGRQAIVDVADTTIGYEELHGLIVTKINGVEMKSLADIPAALAKAGNGLHKVEFSADPGQIWIDAKEADAIGPVLKASYRIPLLQRLD